MYIFVVDNDESTSIKDFHGEYMSQYMWAQEVEARLYFQYENQSDYVS